MRGWRPLIVAALIIVGIPLALVAGAYLYQRTGVVETELRPDIVRAASDSTRISVGVTWFDGGWCLGEFRAAAAEDTERIRVSLFHEHFTHPGQCAGVGTAYNRAWVDVVLSSAVGSRTIARADSTELPVLGPGDRFIREAAVSADISRFGGLNDTPPMALQEHASVTDLRRVRALTAALDALPSFPPGTIFCPMDDGSYYTVVLHYSHGGDTALKIGARGCNPVYVDGAAKPAAWTVGAQPPWRVCSIRCCRPRVKLVSR